MSLLKVIWQRKIVWHPWIGAIAGLVIFWVMAIATPAWAAENNSHWSYSGADNPTHWGDLSPNFSLCKTGVQQSPINLSQPVEGDPSTITFDYQDTPLAIVNNGHTIQVNYVPGSKVTIADETYELLQLHFHTPSEHKINGKAFPMELHLVHRNPSGTLAVVGVMVDEGTANPTIDQIWKNLPKMQQSLTVKDKTINAATLLPPSKAYFSYIGSLTTPPCSENVRWNILTTPIAFSEEQIAAFEAIYPMNARPVQASNGRSIEIHGT